MPSYDRTVYESESGDLALALAGECLISRGVSMYREPNFLKLVDMIKGSDLAITHAEMLFHNYEDAPTHLSGGTYMRSDPRNIGELQWMGFNMLSTASNHSYDFGENAVITNINYLDRFNMPQAGTGRNLAEARAPKYLETPKGRVALLSATTSGPAGGRAGEQRRDIIGRPGRQLHSPHHGVRGRPADLRRAEAGQRGAGLRGGRSGTRASSPSPAPSTRTPSSTSPASSPATTRSATSSSPWGRASSATRRPTGTTWRARCSGCGTPVAWRSGWSSPSTATSRARPTTTRRST